MIGRGRGGDAPLFCSLPTRRTAWKRISSTLKAILQTALLCINIKYVETEISIFGWRVNHCCPLQYKKNAR